MDIVPVSNKIKATVHKNCTSHGDGSGNERCEYLVYLSVPKAGGDGILLGVAESELAAETISSQLNMLFGVAHTHP